MNGEEDDHEMSCGSYQNIATNITRPWEKIPAGIELPHKKFYLAHVHIIWEDTDILIQLL